jgi:alpha-beta hydrolase superfamily lysophospholipase
MTDPKEMSAEALGKWLYCEIVINWPTGHIVDADILDEAIARLRELEAADEILTNLALEGSAMAALVQSAMQAARKPLPETKEEK